MQYLRDGSRTSKVWNGIQLSIYCLNSMRKRFIIEVYVEKFLLSFPLLLFLMVTLEFIFVGAIVGKITTGLVLEATANCLFNILYVVTLMIAKETRKEIERRRNPPTI